MKTLIASLAALVTVHAAILPFAGPAQGQGKTDQKSSFHPTRTVTIVVPYSPGGGTDAVGRLMAKELEAMWGQTVLIDNRTGGNGSVGAALVARAQPDGHTMVLAVSGIAINAHLLKLPYDTATAFAPRRSRSKPSRPGRTQFSPRARPARPLPSASGSTPSPISPRRRWG